MISYAAGAERFHELVERDGLKPAPYMARIFWVAAERWDAWRNAEWEDELRAAHAMTYAKLTKKMREVLALPAKGAGEGGGGAKEDLSGEEEG